MEKCETFYNHEEALGFQKKHPGAEITHKPGYPTFVDGNTRYIIPEDRPSWTVWWTE